MNTTAQAGRRLIAALSSAALVAAGLFTVAHHVEERHEVCDEHGELIHVAATDISMAPAADLPAVTTTERDANHDEHCSVIWSTPPTPLAQATALQSCDSSSFENTYVLALTAPPAKALFRLAPKNSPPA